MKRKVQGFSLIEVLIAVAILSFILSMIHIILISTISSKKYVETQTYVDRLGSKLLAIIIRDIQSAYIYQLEEPYFVGESEKINFVTNNDSLLNSEDLKSDICEVGYFLKPVQNESMTYKIIRREDFFVDDDLLKGGYSIKLYDRVAKFNLAYIDDKGDKREVWDSKRNKGLPKAVFVNLGIHSAPRNSDFETLQRNVKYFKAYIPIIVSLKQPEKKEKKSKKKK